MSYYPRAKSEYYDSVAEARYYEYHPDKKPLDGSTPMSTVEGELEEGVEDKEEEP